MASCVRGWWESRESRRESREVRMRRVPRGSERVKRIRRRGWVVESWVGIWIWRGGGVEESVGREEEGRK